MFVLFVQTIKTEIQDCCAHTESLALETIERIQVVRSFKGEKLELRRYSEAVLQMQKLRLRQEVYGVVYGFVQRVRWLIIVINQCWYLLVLHWFRVIIFLLAQT